MDGDTSRRKHLARNRANGLEVRDGDVDIGEAERSIVRVVVCPLTEEAPDTSRDALPLAYRIGRAHEGYVRVGVDGAAVRSEEVGNESRTVRWGIHGCLRRNVPLGRNVGHSLSGDCKRRRIGHVWNERGDWDFGAPARVRDRADEPSIKGIEFDQPEECDAGDIVEADTIELKRRLASRVA